MSIIPSGMFSVDPKSTPEQLAQRKALMAMLRPKYGSARYVGEGLGQLATGIVEGLQNRQMRKIEGAGRDTADALFSGLFGAANPVSSSSSGQPVGQPMNILGVDPAYDKNDPTQISGDTMAALGKDAGTAGYRASLIGTESGGNWKASNNEMGAGGQSGHFGRVQFGKARLQEAMDAGAIPQGTTPEQFMNSPALQIAAENWHFADLEKQLGDLVGKEVNGQVMDMGALVAMGHLGGAGGARKYVESGGAYNPSDSFGTSLSDYAMKHGGQVSMSAQDGAPMPFNSATPAIPTDQLLAAMANPWLTPEQRAILTTVYDQQVQAGDPMRALELQKAQLELDHMKAPPEDYTSRMFMAQAAGLEPGTPEFQSYLLTGDLPQPAEPGFRTMTPDEVAQLGLPEGAYQMGPKGEIKPIGGGGVNVSVNTGAEGQPQPQLGTIPQGFSAVPDPASPAGFRMVAIPGGPEDTAAQDAAKASGIATGSDVITSAASRAISANKERLLGGAFGALAAYNPSTPNAEVYRQVDVLKANATIENLQAMRAESPTGGALGNVTEGEGKKLADQAGALDPASPNFERDLMDYTRTLLRTIHGKEAGDAIFAQQFGTEEGGWSGSAMPPQGLQDDPLGLFK